MFCIFKIRHDFSHIFLSNPTKLTNFETCLKFPFIINFIIVVVDLAIIIIIIIIIIIACNV